MLNRLILKYVDSLKIEDIEEFSKKQGVILKKEESKVIYLEIKTNLNNVIYHTDEVLLKIKDKLEPTTYLKMKELLEYYKKKYPDYLNYL